MRRRRCSRCSASTRRRRSGDSGGSSKRSSYGTPPHAGFAIGIDRLVSILQDEPNIREVMPFPKTQTGADPLTGSPSTVEPAQLLELGIDIRPEVTARQAELPDGVSP